MGQKNKVKYGLKNVHYAVGTVDEITNTATYGAVKAWPGAVNFTQDAQGDTTKFRADNTDYWVGNSNNGYQGDLESALIPDDFRKEVLGDIEDSNGVMFEDAGAKTKIFALMFQFEGDVSATRHILYNCTATRPSVSGKTTEETIEPQTERVQITSVAIHNAVLDKDIVKARCTEDNPKYATFFDEVYQPEGIATYSTVSFNTDGGTAIPDQTVRNGATAEKPDDPTKSGYTFGGWYKEDTFTTAFDFADPITADTTIYAKFDSE